MGRIEASVYDELREVAYALSRLNIDWQAATRDCGHPQCDGGCRYVARVRQFVREHDSGILPPGHDDTVLVQKFALKMLYECAKDYDRRIPAAHGSEWAYAFREMFDETGKSPNP